MADNAAPGPLAVVNSRAERRGWCLTQRKGSVVAVVSKQYNANDFITGYQDSAIAYEHTGAAQTLSSLRVKVIDPLTKLPVKGLGKNSTVFMEVVQPTPQQKP